MTKLEMNMFSNYIGKVAERHLLNVIKREIIKLSYTSLKEYEVAKGKIVPKRKYKITLKIEKVRDYGKYKRRKLEGGISIPVPS